MKLKKLAIKGFRGFNKLQEIPLEANVILVYGLNGSGKSSFTEAIEWLFFGEISRKRLSRCSSEYQYEEYLGNLHTEDMSDRYVQAEVETDGEVHIIKKSILKNDETELFLDGKPVEDFNRLPVNLSQCFRPMLAQTEIRCLVDTEPKDRWEQLSRILGQDDLIDLRDRIIELRNNKKSGEYKDKEHKFKALLHEIQQYAEFADVQIAFAGLDVSATLTKIAEICRSGTTINELLISISDTQNKLTSGDIGQRIAQLKPGSLTHIEAVIEGLLERLGQLVGYAKQATEAGIDHDHIDFLLAGKKVAKPPTCPFCLEDTLTNNRLREITQEISQADKARIAKESFDSLQKNLREFPSEVKEVIRDNMPALNELRIIAQNLSTAKATKLASAVQDFERTYGSFLEELEIEIRQVMNDFLSTVQVRFFARTGQPNINEEFDKVQRIASNAIARLRQLIEQWSSIRASVLEDFPASSADTTELKRWIEIEKVVSFIDQNADFIAGTKILEHLELLQEKLELFEKTQLTHLLKEHSEEIKEYYGRLNPGESIQFVGIKVKTTGKRRQAKLGAESKGTPINPVTIFSEAHTNSLALSIYFPQRVKRNVSWDVMILDDPVQSMDENHCQSLIEIIADISNEKQVIVLTHSKSFYRKLSARLNHLRPLAYNFFYNDPEKDIAVVLDEGDTVAFIERADTYTSKGDRCSQEEAGHCLRKAIESLCVEILLQVRVPWSKIERLKNNGLRFLFEAVETSAGVKSNDTGKLKSLLDMSDPSSHAWTIVDVTPGAIKQGITNIQAVRRQAVRSKYVGE